ncbi:hypothetical protein GALL_159030 [mine drainage metagenome]|uniref:Sirohydrochlorin cobaltochelatase n=1 Tax=mine drainage metagenome TaxID=410659 RepID=A0A1J5SCX7_9ZZZZ
MSGLHSAALLLVGHGAAAADGGEGLRRLAAALRARRLFAEVEPCFCRQPPLASLDLVRSPTVHVVPVFSGDGVFTRRIIPERLGLCGPESRVAGRRVLLSPPVGAHPAIPALLARRARAFCRARGLPPEHTALLLAAHGSPRPDAPPGTAAGIAAVLARRSGFAEVAAGYLEQPPFLTAWPTLVAARDVLLLPLLLAEGRHAGRDLPALAAAAPAGRRLWLLPGLGRDPALGDIVFDLVAGGPPS